MGAVQGGSCTASGLGPVIHGALDAVLSRVERAGGRIVVPRTDIGPPGFIAIILDCEGNSVGLHSARSFDAVTIG